MVSRGFFEEVGKRIFSADASQSQDASEQQRHSKAALTLIANRGGTMNAPSRFLPVAQVTLDRFHERFQGEGFADVAGTPGLVGFLLVFFHGIGG